MKKTFLLFSCAGALALASCSQEKAAETTTTTTTTETVSTPATEATYRTRANRIATRMATDLKITDTTVVARAEDIYFNRSRRLAELEAQYTTDTTGMYTAMQAINIETDREFKTVFSDPAQYEAYVANRMNYAEEMYVAEAATQTASADQGVTKVEADGDTKTKYADGTKVKTESDGEMKIKAADGSKAKVDDDGEIKMKEE
ncbi:hypothetical protein SAMN00120144_1176 [Hymenobacter roseosalivarius DSM 11622]|uniref:Lipoprotein n=1 Tax=Hymenobacter roseosalivarius DSM 11622 TaxID=645990 RepID=A0A1W1V4C2_9BACT|nr:hypothetical protein [Hymenobacter roseosalivarius]SMB88156.1 hypothetical protein SAMN00120144_1176 [Hymenobacter roseosalivarius DSM 11622]